MALFGDLTYATGLGYTLAREVGLEVAWAGTYLAHLEKDFLFHAHTFTEDAFVEDDPEAVAARVEETAPDLLVGTHLEREVAEALDLPFLPLCPPIFERSFVERPSVGYAGSTVLADALEGALHGPQTRARGESSRGAPRTPEWTEEALEELEEIPAFVRRRARRLAEEHARTLDSPAVTPEILEESLSCAGIILRAG